MATETSKYESQSQTKKGPKMLDIQKIKASRKTSRIHQNQPKQNDHKQPRTKQ